MKARVAVLGGGIAGVAAAWSACRSGAQVTLYHAGPGASVLSSGAVDDAPWEQAPPDEPRSLVEVTFAESLDLWTFPSQRPQVATGAGVLRSARGVDRSVLDLAPLFDTIVGVLDVKRPGWHAVTLAAAWSNEPWAKQHCVRFIAIESDIFQRTDELLIPDADLAALYDDTMRQYELAKRLRALTMQTPCAALLVGPWLGQKAPAGPLLSAAINLPVGEVLSPPGGPAGLRLQAALDRILQRSSLQVQRGAARLFSYGPVWNVESTGNATATFDKVILAVGGLVGGGIVYESSDPISLTIATGFRLPCWPFANVHYRDRVDGDFASDSRKHSSYPNSLERVGVTHRQGAVCGPDGSLIPGLFVVGDAAYNVSRSLLQAVRTGILAGEKACIS